MKTTVALCLLSLTAVVVQTQDISYIASRFTFQGISKTKGGSEEDVLNEVVAFLDWVVDNNPGEIFGYQNEVLVPKRGRYDVGFDLQYNKENVDIVSFLNDQLATYKNTADAFTVIVPRSLNRLRKGEEVNVFGDPHVAFDFKDKTFCFDTLDPLNETLELYEATDLGIKLNIDFRSDRPNSPKDHTWINDVAVLSPDVTVTVDRNGINVENNNDGTQQTLAWGTRDFLEINNNYVSVNGQQMLYLKYADETADVELVEVGVFRAMSGSLDLRFTNEDGVQTSGFVPSLIDQIDTVNETADPNNLDMVPVWDENQVFPVHRYKDNCWKISDGAHQLFQYQEDWQTFIRGCLTCDSQDSNPPQ